MYIPGLETAIIKFFGWASAKACSAAATNAAMHATAGTIASAESAGSVLGAGTALATGAQGIMEIAKEKEKAEKKVKK